MTDPASPSAPLRIQAVLRDTRDGPVWMQVVTFLWFISTFAIFPGNEYFLYPLTLVFIGTLYFERERIMPILTRSWFLFLIPIMGLISFTWAAYPADAIRMSSFFLLSALSVVIIASLLTERQILRAFFFTALGGTALAISELGVILSSAQSEYLGQKNFYAMKMMIGMIAGFGVAMNPNENVFLRILGFILVPIDFFLVLAAQSATSLVLSSSALMLMILAQLFWVSSRHIRGMRTLVGGFSVATAGALALIALGAVNSSLMNDALGALGKDTTFTGRTALWEQAERTSAEHPVLGVGMASFWQYDIGAAQTLAENDGRDPGTALGFHNTYLETRVHLGYIGLILMIVTVGLCLWKAAKSFLVEATFERTCFFVGSLIIFAMTFTESILFGFFHPGVYIFQLAAVTAIVSAYRKRKIFLNLIPENDDEDAPTTPLPVGSGPAPSY